MQMDEKDFSPQFLRYTSMGNQPDALVRFDAIVERIIGFPKGAPLAGLYPTNAVAGDEVLDDSRAPRNTEAGRRRLPVPSHAPAAAARHAACEMVPAHDRRGHSAYPLVAQPP